MKRLLSLLLAFSLLFVFDAVPSYAVVATTNITNTGTGDGVTTAFPFTFATLSNSDVQVFVNGIQIFTGFTVSRGVGGIGGTVNFTSAPASFATVLIKRILPITQTTHLSPDGVLSEVTLENAYDKLTMISQQLNASGGGTVTSVTPGTGLSNSGTSTAPILNNTGVLGLTAGSNVTLGGTAQNPIINSTGGGSSGNVYTSPDQVITTNGTLGPFAHGLGVVPASVVCALVCQTGELGYSAGDITYAITAPSSGSLGKFVADATNINLTYGSGTKVFGIYNKSTLAAADATNANWKLRIYASNVIISGGGGGGGGGVPGNTLGANQFANSINSSGVISGAQVGFSNLSGSAVNSQLPVVDIAHGGTNNASLPVTAGTVYYADGTKIVGLAPGSGFLQLNGASAPTIVAGSGVLQIAHVQLSSAQIIALNGTPITLVAAQGAGTTVVVHTTLWRMTPGATPFNGNLNPVVAYSGGNNITSTVSSAVINSSSPSETIRNPNDVTAVQNTAVVIKASAGAATTGNGTLDMYVTYSVH